MKFAVPSSIDFDVLGINALNADVRCNPNKIVITIEKSTIPRLQAGDLHLEEFSCRARENSTHIIFETKPYECRTSVKAFGTAVEYKNVIYSDEKFVDGIIDRTNSFKLPFKCVFVPSLRPNFSRRIRVKKPQIKFSGSEFQYLNLEVKLLRNAYY